MKKNMLKMDKKYLTSVWVFLLYFTASFSMVYFSMNEYDIVDNITSQTHPDVAEYLKIYRGENLHEIPKPFRYRIVIPYLAKTLPSISGLLPKPIAKFYHISSEKEIKFKFGLINLLSLTGCALMLYILCIHLGFSSYESLLSGYIYLTSFYILNYATIPMVDAGAYFFLILCIVSILKKWNIILFFSVLIGMGVKETTIIALVVILLMKHPWKTKITQIIVSGPGILSYIIFRFVIAPTQIGYNYGIKDILDRLNLLSIGTWWWIGFEGLLAFGIVWVFAWKGWKIVRKTPENPLRPLLYFIPLILLLPFVFGTNYGRIWFMAFPVLIPLGLIGMKEIFKSELPEN